MVLRRSELSDRLDSSVSRLKLFLIKKKKVVVVINLVELTR